MGSYAGAEIWELANIYILAYLTTFIGKNNVGLYRDNGLTILRELNGQQTGRIRKRIIETFKSFGFKIEIMTNLPEVTFLDAMFDLRTNTYRPYRKPKQHPKLYAYVVKLPPEILKRLPTSISKLISKIYSNEQIFGLGKTRIRRSIEKVGISGISRIYRVKSWKYWK